MIREKESDEKNVETECIVSRFFNEVVDVSSINEITSETTNEATNEP